MLLILAIDCGKAVYASATTERTDVLSVKGIRPMFPTPTSLLQASLQNLLGSGNAVYASATTERTDVLSVKGIRPMFPNPISLLQASLQNLLGSGNADANFQNILNCMKYIKNIDN